ncbi:hypothetical protein ACFOY2_25575 [Nonomuraea purpurea]|uniref:[acyl-carrier-protein] S-malonyltransferase n=1 Tax=Nonomuraea purpurea TaxID=1849276 RepID=A0ABV8G9J3_9ACTN
MTPPPSSPSTVIGWVDDRPIPRTHLDQRLSDLRNGPLRTTLPTPGSSEDRQLARWLTQVILTEAACESAATELARSTPSPREPALDRIAAVELGSINAAAYNNSPHVRAMFHHVTTDVTIPSEWQHPRPSPHPSHHLVHHRLFTDPTRARKATPADLEPLGPITLDSLPTAIAEALSQHPHGTLVGPVEDTLGWHVATAVPAPTTNGRQPPPEKAPDQHLLAAARRRAFARWLDDLRAQKIRLVPGLEHPGDPRQPDNHHKH